MKYLFLKLITKTFKKHFGKLGYEIIKLSKPEMVINYFQTNYSKNVLISYITHPFTCGSNLSHTNIKECYQIAKTFHDFGYNVDVVDFSDTITEIGYEKYDVIFGFGDPVNNNYYKERKEDLKTIYYGTGCHIEFQNPQSLIRVLEVKKRTGRFLPESGRIVEKAWSLQTTLVDGMIILGNEHTATTYKKNYKNGQVMTVPASFHKVYKIDLINKDFSKAKTNFLWFGSSGMIHKGLDICLEVFENRDEITLHVCGPILNEKRFMQHYYDSLYKSQNIINHGFIDIASEKFKDLMEMCAFVIFPSASEGSSPSVLTAMGNGGLIPLISKACGLNVEPFGFVFEKLEKQSIEINLNMALQLSDKELFTRSEQSLKYAYENHSFENFSSKMRQAIINLLDHK